MKVKRLCSGQRERKEAAEMFDLEKSDKTIEKIEDNIIKDGTEGVLTKQWEESINDLDKSINDFLNAITNSIIQNAKTLKDVDILLDLFGKMGWKYPYCRQWEDHVREKVKEKISNIAIK